jgi:hypothetical protein
MNGNVTHTWAFTGLAGLVLIFCLSRAASGEPKTLKLIQTIPLKGAAGRLDRIYVGNGIGAQCNVFDGKDYQLLKSIPLPGADNVRYLASRNLVYVGHGEKALSVIDASAFDVKATIKLPGRPEGFQLETKRPRLYMNTVDPTRLVVVDTDKNEVLHSYALKLSDRAYPMALDTANQRIFLGMRNKPAVVIVDSENGKEGQRRHSRGHRRPALRCQEPAALRLYWGRFPDYHPPARCRPLREAGDHSDGENGPDLLLRPGRRTSLSGNTAPGG